VSLFPLSSYFRRALHQASYVGRHLYSFDTASFRLAKNRLFG